MRNAGGVTFAAVCDLNPPSRAEAKTWAGPEARAYKDFRDLLEQRDLDAVLIATPDHWHAIPTVLACEAGKHIYVEKPLAHNILEGQAMVKAARSTGKIVAAGTQQRSATHFPECADMVQGGSLGDVRMVRVWNYSNIFPKGFGRVPDSEPPKGLDWDFYLGPAPKVPFNRLRFLATYRFFWDYAGGTITDFGTHRFDTVHQIIGATAPRAVSASGGRFSIEDDTETPDILQATYEYPGFVLSYEACLLNAHGLGGRTPGMKYYNARRLEDRPNGMAFYGTKGALFADRYGYDVYPEAGSDVPRKHVQSYDATDRHTRNFVEAVRGKSKCAAPIELGHQATTVAHLGNIAFHTGRKIRWDAEKEECVDDAEANRRLGRKARKPWDLITCESCY
jgi:predicted dehydrogenase